MKKTIYEYGKCDYCGEINCILRPTPFMADGGAMMCEHCWNNTQEEYANSNGEYIPNFNSCKGYKEIKEQVLTNESLKEVLETIADCSDCDSPIEQVTLNRINELESQTRDLMQIIKRINDCKYEPDKIYIYVDRALKLAKVVE